MNKLIATLVFLTISSNLAADTFLYRVPIAFGKTAAQTVGNTVGKSGKDQPFYGTYVLTPADTNYLLLKVSADTQLKLDQTQPFDLYQIQKFSEDGFIVNALDNSALFPIDKNWAVVKASAIIVTPSSEEGPK